jgi:hypothetical protein
VAALREDSGIFHETKAKFVPAKKEVGAPVKAGIPTGRHEADEGIGWKEAGIVRDPSTNPG